VFGKRFGNGSAGGGVGWSGVWMRRGHGGFSVWGSPLGCSGPSGRWGAWTDRPEGPVQPKGLPHGAGKSFMAGFSQTSQGQLARLCFSVKGSWHVPQIYQ